MASEETKVAPANPFKLDRDALADFNVDQMREQNKEKLEKYGGVQAVAAALEVDLSSGITGDDAGLRAEVYVCRFHCIACVVSTVLVAVGAAAWC